MRGSATAGEGSAGSCARTPQPPLGRIPPRCAQSPALPSPAVANPGDSRAADVTDGFALPGSRGVGCLLVHGFTANPSEMRPVGEALAARGFPVRAVRLA